MDEDKASGEAQQPGTSTTTKETPQNKQQLPLLVVSGDGPSLWGRDGLSAIQLNWAHIKQVCAGLSPLLQKYSKVFQEELGTLKRIEAKLQG